MGFKDIGKNIGKGVKKATDKLNNTVDVQKLKYKISKKEEEIGEVYRLLGQNIVDASLRGETYDALVAKALEDVALKREELAALNRERIEKEGKTICTNCGSENDGKAEFCSRCGAKIEREETPAEKEADNETGSADPADETKTEENGDGK